MRDLPAPALPGVVAVDCLLAERGRQLFKGGGLFAAEEDGAVHVADDGIRIVLVDGLELGQCLEHKAAGNLTGADSRHQLFQPGDLPDVRGLVDEAAHMDRQTPAVHIVGLFAEHIEKLRIAKGDQKIERVVRIAHNEEQRRFLVSQGIQLQFVVGHDLPQLANVKGGQTCSTAHKDALCGLARRQLEFGILPHGKVIRFLCGQLIEEQVHRIFEALILLSDLHGVYELHEAVEILFLLRRFVPQVADERRVEQGLGLDPKIVPGFGVPGCVGNERRHELQNVLLRMDVGEGIVFHGFLEVDRVQHLDFITVVDQHPARFQNQRSLRVCDHERARVLL